MKTNELLLTPSKIFHRLEREFYFGGPQSYTYIILGRPGPTGKTTLCNMLKSKGYNAFEISESLTGDIDYMRNGNNYCIDHSNHTVVITLNAKIIKEK